ncbi:MAG: glycosyltransferase involved in cell wall biosynthesis [Flavobacteriales bacterium]|jgi:glycosyltransferase involved in cell wall biosynthesis
MSTTLSLVVPCYNEVEALPETVKQLTRLLEELIASKQIDATSFLCFVDDGSVDGTWELIKKYSSTNGKVKGLKLSFNVGHQGALYAGIEHAILTSNCVVTIDADLQDDHTVIADMLKRYKEGFEVVFGVRDDRKTDSFFKRVSAQLFYKLMHFMGVKIVYNHADFRLLGQKAVNSFLRFKERNMFIRGIIPLVGFKNTNVYYKRKERNTGASKYPFSKMLSFAWEGITSFSIIPLKLITSIGFIIFLLSIIMGFYSFYIVLFTDRAIQGWASTIIPIYFLGGIQLLSIGIIGEYVGKIYKEVKNRPRYLIDETIR